MTLMLDRWIILQRLISKIIIKSWTKNLELLKKQSFFTIKTKTKKLKFLLNLKNTRTKFDEKTKTILYVNTKILKKQSKELHNKKRKKNQKEEIDKQGTKPLFHLLHLAKINVTLEFTLEEKTQNIKYNLFLPNYRSLKYFHLSYKTKLDLKVNQLNELEFLDSNSKVIFKESAPLFFQKGFVFKGKYFLSQQSPPLKSNTSTSTSTSTNTNTNIKTNTNIDIKTKDTKNKTKTKKNKYSFWL
ncbi:hypothetical protein M0813_30174 [Anaeramoeba flamelloides]|uniref:Ribosomal protein L5 n=1 Tax=Anaeramoeba flamelloides TaxID=1746091 RepID=A0ABQ8XLW8_9EUKA|nr:hypothetical protein M0813_30174 [Anaeramoeba flamelloides]